MGVEGAGKCLKILLFIFNFIFWVAGCAILGVGAYVHVKKGDFAEISTISFLTGANLCIAVGAIVMVVAFFGCCGAWKECKWMLGMFFFFLLLLFCLEVAAGVLGYSYKDEVANQVDKDLNVTIMAYGKDSNSGGNKAINAIQQEEQCCGVLSYKDYMNTPFGNGTSKVPDSCCRKQEKGCGAKTPLNTDDIYTEGCKDKVESSLKGNLLLIGGIAIAVCVIQILGMIFSMCLLCKIRANEQFA